MRAFSFMVILSFFCLTTARAEDGGLLGSRDFDVSINGQPIPIYQVDASTNHGANGVTTMSFGHFNFSSGCLVSITAKTPVSTFQVRPASSEIITTQQGSSISFSLTETGHYLITTNNSYNHCLVLSADPPHPVVMPADVEHFFGPGVHKIGLHFPLKTNDDVYLAEGAVIVGSFAIENAENVSIKGPGVILGSAFPHQENFQVIRGWNAHQVTLEGITICDAPGWIISFWGDSQDLTVRNVKTVGSFRYNTDGVQTGTVGLHVENCFLQCNDDNFSLNGLCQNVEINNNVLWNLYNGGVFMLGWATGEKFDLQNLDIHDNVILRAGGCCDYDMKGPFSMKLFGSHRVAKNIHFKNIIIEDLAAYGRWLDFQAGKANQTHVSDITFENIQINKAWAIAAELHGCNAEFPMQEIRFQNINILGQAAKTPAELGLNLINTKNVTINETAFEDSLVESPLIVAIPETSQANSPTVSTPPSLPTENLLTNPDFQQQLTGWTFTTPQGCLVESLINTDESNQHLISVTNRKSTNAGIEQDITDILNAHGPGHYTFAASVRGVNSVVPVRVTLAVTDELSTQCHPSPEVQATPDAWQTTSRRQPLSWSRLQSAKLIIDTGYGNTDSFQIQQAQLAQ